METTKLTVAIPSTLHRDLKIAAAEQSTTVQELVIAALNKALTRKGK